MRYRKGDLIEFFDKTKKSFLWGEVNDIDVSSGVVKYVVMRGDLFNGFNIYVLYENEIAGKKAREGRCTCGSEKTNQPGHSTWCDAYGRF